MVSCFASHVLVSGVCFRDGMLAHWVTHTVDVSLRTPG